MAHCRIVMIMNTIIQDFCLCCKIPLQFLYFFCSVPFVYATAGICPSPQLFQPSFRFPVRFPALRPRSVKKNEHDFKEAACISFTVFLHRAAESERSAPPRAPQRHARGRAIPARRHGQAVQNAIRPPPAPGFPPSAARAVSANAQPPPAPAARASAPARSALRLPRRPAAQARA